MITSNTLQFNTSDVKIYLAAAGSGKTYALMEEIVELLKVYRPDEIAFVTYTRKGVNNGIDRICRLTEVKKEELTYFKTLHAMCFRELELKPENMVNRKFMKKFNDILSMTVYLRNPNENQTSDDQLLTRYEVIRSGAKYGVFVHGMWDESKYKRLIRAYKAFKDANNLKDFHDCLQRFVDRDKSVPVKVAFIDEAQDLTLLQWEVCKVAFSNCEKIRISGDDYQCLFRYAGASPATLISLCKKYETIKLEVSYRLPKTVYEVAKSVTKIIEDKIDKDFKPVKKWTGFVEFIVDRQLLVRHISRDFGSYGVSPNRWYLLFRNNCFIEPIALMLEQFTLPYHNAKGFCLDDRHLAKIERYYNYRKEGYSCKEVFEKFCKDNNIEDINNEFIESDLIPSERKYVYLDYVNKFGVDRLLEMSKGAPTILLSTTHKVKGGEADYVVVFLDCTKKVWDNKMINIDEELRVLYVACTRAKLGLYLASSNTRYGLDDVFDLVKEGVV